ncbi:MAG: endonuclease/exonuclease/phosphatase family protein [Candidatus Odinarchaeota archaeon]
MSLNENLLGLIFIFSPALLILYQKRFSNKILLVSGALVIISKVLEAYLTAFPQIKMIFAGIGVGGFFIFFPAFLLQKKPDDAEKSAITLANGLALALMLSIFFRTAGSTIDISSHGLYQLIGWSLAAIAIFLLIGLYYTNQEIEINKEHAKTDLETKINSGNSLKIVLLTTGLVSVLLMVYFTFSSPTVISRWTEGNYILITLILLLVFSLFTVLELFKPELLTVVKPLVVWFWNGAFVLALVLTILLHQLTFSASAGNYPFTAPPVTLLHLLPLFLMIVLSPVILVDFNLLSRELIETNPGKGTLTIGFTLTSLFLVLMIFAQVFTTVYDYIPVVGPFFRNKFWLVFLITGLAVALPVFLVKKQSYIFSKSVVNLQNQIFAVLLGLLLIGTVAGAVITTPFPPVPETKTSVKILTYNIQQGFNEDGIKNFAGQLEVIRGVDADIIGLQECDTARIANGNADIVRYIADNLNLYSYYGPTTTVGTFGIALLSKYPILNARTFFMYSEGEQTATIEAQIQVETTTFNVYVTHLGNGGPIVQQEAIMDEINGQSDIILIGDFNFRPDTEQYNITTATLDDTWLLKWPTGVDDSEYNASRRIDHVFVSPGTTISDCRFIESPASDHPALWVKIEL